MPKVYVAGALIPTGGAYMAYHIGRLLSRHFGYEMVDVHMYDLERSIFQYDTPLTTVSIGDMERAITPDDLLVCNPSFSQFLFGLRLPGRKIMYVQDFRTFMLLDCHFDLYVSVSQLVARYVYGLYAISMPVIPAFIETTDVAVTPWEERPPGSALVYMKNPSREHQIVLQTMQRRLQKLVPQVDLTHVLEGRGLTREEFLREIGSVRYFVNLSLAEGFGLVPLEAMMMGTMVTGVDGLAGRDYMRQGQNCLTGSIRDLRKLPKLMQHAFEDEALAKRCVEGGLQTARMYGYDAFSQAWLRELSQFLGRNPDAA